MCFTFYKKTKNKTKKNKKKTDWSNQRTKGNKSAVVINFCFVVQCYFIFFKPFYLVSATTGGLLISLCVYFEIGTLAFASLAIPVDHSDLKCSHDLYVDNFYG